MNNIGIFGRLAGIFSKRKDPFPVDSVENVIHRIKTNIKYVNDAYTAREDNPDFDPAVLDKICMETGELLYSLSCKPLNHNDKHQYKQLTRKLKEFYQS